MPIDATLLKRHFVANQMLYDVFARMEDANLPAPVLAKSLKTFVAFEPSCRPTFPAVIGKQPAFAFVTYEADDNSADAPDTEAEHEGAERGDKAHRVFHRSEVQDRRLATCARFQAEV
jgi:hypothetical protein